jgi:hypothetical protein
LPLSHPTYGGGVAARLGAVAATFSLLLVCLFGRLNVNPVLSVEDLGADLDLLPVSVACIFSLVPPCFPVEDLGADLDLEIET